MFNIEEELKKLPNKPGVYIMKNKEDKILYVGKAVILKNRVRQYFRKNNKTARIEKMVSQVDHFEYIVTDNEAEALILECNLIKKNRPKFNVLLKDDKTYPYIKIDVKSDYPNVFITRTIKNDGAKYFGPYANPGAAKEMLDFIKQRYKIRQCKNFKYADRPCLNYHIKRCLAPCTGKVSKEEYYKQIDEVISLLEGKTDKIIKKLDMEIKELSQKLEFEKAAVLRDKKIAIERISEKQKVSNISENNIDVIGIANNGYEVCIEIFFVRSSKMIDRKHYFYSDLIEMDKSEILSQFIKQYYIENLNVPSKIMCEEDIEDREALENLLTKKVGRKIEIKVPKKGEKLKLVEMAKKNSELTLENKYKDKQNIVEELKKVLNLKILPKKIECYDISNISGNFIVAAMCTMENGEIKRNLSRRFKIKTVLNQDDPKCMKEVIERRLEHSINTNEDGFGKLPDVIFVDGGITQIRAAIEALKNKNLNIPVYGMVKNNKHKTKGLLDKNRTEINLSENLMNQITNFQDTVHDTAISYHKKLRDKEMSKSKLDNITGIGQVKKQELLKKFGSVEKIKSAKIEEICKLKGINRVLAEKIKEMLN